MRLKLVSSPVEVPGDIPFSERLSLLSDHFKRNPLSHSLSLQEFRELSLSARGYNIPSHLSAIARLATGLNIRFHRIPTASREARQGMAFVEAQLPADQRMASHDLDACLAAGESFLILGYLRNS